MTFFADLTPCTYFEGTFASPLTAVGWLGRDHPYSQGKTSAKFFDQLRQLLIDVWTPVAYRGFHECELCLKKSLDGPTDHWSHLNLFVPGEGNVYVAPEGILHYIEVHGYKPPREFCDAVKRCPKQRSPDFFEALRLAGFRISPRCEADVKRTAEIFTGSDRRYPNLKPRRAKH